MIVGTAGHIDHGKTTLVKALTGVDTDRLPQEKERGITIELGYAYLDRGPGLDPLGFVDVPGHERLVHTMLAGASGISFGMLVVAADDGPMPQTLEHLAILALLGIERGLVALSKCDRADATQRAAVGSAVEALLLQAGLPAYRVFEVSAISGEGLEAIRSHLLAQASVVRDRAAQPDPEGSQPGPSALDESHAAPGASPKAQDASHAAPGAAAQCGFRLAIDRVFTLEGHGSVAAGPVHAGRVAPGRLLRLIPGDLQVRVRSIHAQGRAVSEASTGQRAALALAGLQRQDLSRGQWLVDPGIVSVSDRIDARVRLWPGERQGLRSGTQVHLHLGAEAVTGSVANLDRDVLLPGEEGLVQLVCHRAIGAWHRDRVVLRDASASRTLAGGIVLDPAAPVRYRRTAQRLAQLRALAIEHPGQRIAALLESSPLGIGAADYLRRQAGHAAVSSAPSLRLGEWLLDEQHAKRLMAVIVQQLEEYHRLHPLDAGIELQRLRRLACPRFDADAFRALIQVMCARGMLAVQGAFLHHPEHALRLSAREQAVSESLAPHLRAAGFHGAWVRDLVKHCRHEETIVRATLATMARAGQVHPVVKDLYYAPEVIDELVAIALRLAESTGERGVRAAQYRDAIGLGRHRAIQILEYFDRIGVLRRVGDLHRMRAESAWARAPVTMRVEVTER
ncbi:MAG: selenocysteine-specific translation elongation factor [Betaproteobacteria bacterium]|nr:selenocysteine-specific translation elongation factor [Betaproteobacteria bacterium]